MSGNSRGRRNWTLSMSVALLAAAAAAAIGSIDGDGPAVADRYYLTSTAGQVLFDHGKHNDMVDSCSVCHHTLFGSAVAISCDECHGDEVDPADSEHRELTQFHGGDCATCHEQVAEDDQAASCRDCHAASRADETGLAACAQCHDDGYDQDMLEHAEYIEIEDHSCLGCHNPASVSDAYHENCTGCHVEEAQKLFVTGDGTENCGGCHLR